MFDIFTDAAKRALVLAQDEAIMLGHDFVSAEHLLLGLAGPTTAWPARSLPGRPCRRKRPGAWPSAS